MFTFHGFSRSNDDYWIDTIISSSQVSADSFRNLDESASRGGYSHKSLWSLQWRHNGREGVSNHQPHHCLLNRLFRRRSKKTSKLRVTDPCAGNSPVTGEFLAQVASNAEKCFHLMTSSCKTSYCSWIEAQTDLDVWMRLQLIIYTSWYPTGTWSRVSGSCKDISRLTLEVPQHFERSRRTSWITAKSAKVNVNQLLTHSPNDAHMCRRPCLVLL